MLVKGSYIEENDFQDDVMVYDLVAKKDSTDLECTKHMPNGSSSEETQHDSADVAPRKAPAASGICEKTKKSLKSKSPTDCNANLQNAAAVEAGEDFLDQYEELIRTLDTESVGKQVKADGDEPKAPVEEPTDEEEMDFTSFSAETPEPDKLLSPFGTVNKLRSGSTNKSPAVPFTGESRGIVWLCIEVR